MLVAMPTHAQTSGAQSAEPILTADRAFNDAVAAGDRARFRSFIAADATFGGGADALRGPDAVVAAWEPFFAANGPRLTWMPTHGELLGSGDLGYTVGTWERRVPTNGEIRVTKGNYLTVWRREKDGSWKVIYDTGSSF
jgi:ketosteroid isomerase-like protein